VVLTIVTVVKNDPEGLRCTLASIKRQKAQSRVLVMDGGSTAETLGVIEEWRSLIPLEVETQPDKGPYDAMNRSLVKLDVDDLVWFVNAGDVLIGEDSISRAQRLTCVEGFTWGFGPHQVIEASGEVRRTVRAWPFTPDRFAYGRSPICHQAVISRVSCLRDVGGFDVSYPIAADFKALLLMGKRWQPAEWADVLVQYRAGGISDRHLPQTIREQGTIRREVLKPPSFALMGDVLYDAYRLTRHRARAALRAMGMKQQHFNALRKTRVTSIQDPQS
jgi:glycosyltransferase involved in cell wall biosynthesis